MQDAVARLSADQRHLVRRCLTAALHGPYLDDDDEFEAIMGLTRDELAETLAAWPTAAAHGSSVYAVSASATSGSVASSSRDSARH